MKCLIALLLFASALGFEDVTLGVSEANPASCCNEIYQRNPTSRGTVDQYWIKTNEGLFKVTCNMKLKCGGVEGGWMQVVDVDMNRDDSCPGTWHKITTPRRLCLGYVAGCASAHFDVKGVSYEHICGEAKGYQKGNPNAFQNSQYASVEGAYVDGISITIGSPHKHVWTYAVGRSDDYDYTPYKINCPCATHPGNSSAEFVGNDYYCESGVAGDSDVNLYYLSNPLWDGNGCTIGSGCCAQIGMPWFYRKLPVPVADDFEVRICKDQEHDNEDVAVEVVKIYILD